MITQFPHTIASHDGHEAIITNPSVGHYHFEMINPANDPDFDLYDETYQHPVGIRIGGEAQYTIAQAAILTTFHQLQAF